MFILYREGSLSISIENREFCSIVLSLTLLCKWDVWCQDRDDTETLECRDRVETETLEWG